MMKAIFQITWREWKRIFSRPEYYLVLVVLPPLLFFFYANIYREQKIADLPVAIWDEDRGPLSRQLTFMLEQAESIHITQQVQSITELRQQVREGHILGAIHFAKGMESDIKSHHPVRITLYTNTASLVPGKLIYKDAAQVIITAGSGVILQKLIKTGMPAAKAMALVMPVQMVTYPLYNPDYNYQQYLVPGLVTVALQMMIIMVAVLLINIEWKDGTMQELRRLANDNAGAVITGKTLAHLGVAWINFVLVAGIVFPIFGLNRTGSTFNLFILFNFLVLACIGIGLMISVLAKDVMLACDVALFYTSPAFVFSGFTFPRWAMPWYDQYYANLMPYTFFLDAFFKVHFMQLPLHYAFPEITKLMLFIGFTFFVAVFFLRLQFKRQPAYAAK